LFEYGLFELINWYKSSLQQNGIGLVRLFWRTYENRLWHCS